MLCGLRLLGRPCLAGRLGLGASRSLGGLCRFPGGLGLRGTRGLGGGGGGGSCRVELGVDGREDGTSRRGAGWGVTGSDVSLEFWFSVGGWTDGRKENRKESLKRRRRRRRKHTISGLRQLRRLCDRVGGCYALFCRGHDAQLGSGGR